MIRTDDVFELLRKRPFEPFRICMSDGRAYEITYPELCLPGRNKLHVAVSEPDEQRFISRVDQCALAHIVRFEALTGEKGNGGV